MLHFSATVLLQQTQHKTARKKFDHIVYYFNSGQSLIKMIQCWSNIYVKCRTHSTKNITKQKRWLLRGNEK